MLFGPSGLVQPRRRRHPGQAEMVAQRLTLVVAAQQAAVLEFRYDQVDKISECAREIGRQYIVTVGGALDEPLFKGVGNPSRGAADDPVAARRGGEVVEVAQGHILPPRHVVEHTVEGAAGFGRRRRWYRSVERVATDIVTDAAGHQGQGVGWGQPALQPVELLLSLPLGPADDRHHAGQYRQLLGRAAVLSHAPLQIGIRLLGAVQFLHDREDDISGARREFKARGRAASLDDDRVPLRAARDAHRPLDLKEPAFVVERPNLTVIDIDPASLVGDQRPVFPTIPQPVDDIDELLGALIAQLVVHLAVEVEVERRLWPRAGDDVPGGAALADVVDRGEQAGYVVGFGKARRYRGAEAEPRRVRAQHRNQARRLEAAHERG